ncbi:PIF-3 [Mocis latipes granulovirus]|uniref:PIF-3 n=1 Tax=Mocis latipes granulovirus TaxID=2072024 RepID=A0A161CD28_9BBAC|nr:PIF-3 [Mocis latipes granulovirus]AKR17411.1 PIF-3 [Mocis latipes granulovirus]
MPWMVLLTVLALLLGIGLFVWHQQERHNTPTFVELVFQRDNILNCESVPTPCVTDQQCIDNCQSGMFMTCQQGFCRKYIQPIEYVGVDDCDISRGMVMVLTALDAFVVQRMCISLYRDVIDDNSDIRPYVCDGGEMLVDLENRPFSIVDCTCENGFTKLAYHQGAFARSTPVCIPNNLVSLYSRIYDPNVNTISVT